MELWSKEHAITLLPAVAVMIVIAFILRATIGKKDMKIRMIPFQILAVLLFLLEIGKQVDSYMNGYDLYHLPFHFCSLFIFMMPIMAFYRGKYENTVRAITTTLCASVFMLMMIYPCLIYGAGNINAFFTEYQSLHTVAFHNIVVFAFILCIALELHTPAPKGEPKVLVIFMLCFCVISASMAHLLKTNFNNFYSCNIPPLETVRVAVAAALGEGVAALVYVLIVTVLDILFVQLAYQLCRGLLRLMSQKTKAESL